jgi:hypothetical protein
MPAGLGKAEQVFSSTIRSATTGSWAKTGLDAGLEFIDDALKNEPSPGDGVTNDPGGGLGAFGVERPPIEDRNRQAFPR